MRPCLRFRSSKAEILLALCLQLYATLGKHTKTVVFADFNSDSTLVCCSIVIVFAKLSCLEQVASTAGEACCKIWRVPPRGDAKSSACASSADGKTDSAQSAELKTHLRRPSKADASASALSPKPAGSDAKSPSNAAKSPTNSSESSSSSSSNNPLDADANACLLQQLEIPSGKKKLEFRTCRYAVFASAVLACCSFPTFSC